MAQLSRTLLACVAICISREAPAQTRADAAPFALTHVTVIDVANGRTRPDQTLIVIGNRIAQVGPSGKILVPRGARIIDAREKFVVPGLWDMHVHLFRHSSKESVDVHEQYFPLFLANGVTGVRDMSTTVEDFQTVRRWRRDEAAGTLLGPRVMGSSTVVDGVPPFWPNSIGVTTAAEARRVVDSLVRGGAEFIKVYTLLPRDAYFAIVDESKRLGVPFAGHLPLSIRATEASDAGQKSIEHLGFMDDCSTARDRIVQLRQDTTLARPEGGLLQLFFNTYSDSLCAALFRRFVRNGTWQVPTLVVHRQSTLDFDTVMLDPHLRYAANEDRMAWATQTQALAQRTTPRQAELRRRRFQKSLDVIAGMQRGGVPTLAGTDVGNPWLVAGFSLHDELALFVQAGMPPLAALQTATINPARYFGALDSLGTIAEGKIADLVLLDGSPLNDIRNIHRIRAVIVNGRLLIRTALDSLLASVQKTPRSLRDPALVERDNVAREAIAGDSVAALLIELERRWAETPSSQKIPLIERIFADDFLGTDPAGRRYTKADRIEHLRKSAVDGPPNHLDDVRVRFFGPNMAVLYGTESSTRKTADGRAEKRMFVWTDTWLKRSGRWQIVAAHDMVAPSSR